jgi:hypothetical protein
MPKPGKHTPLPIVIVEVLWEVNKPNIHLPSGSPAPVTPQQKAAAEATTTLTIGEALLIGAAAIISFAFG